jgi:23S rRNA pseudouridine1911/1915/1917 synthase
MSLVWKWQADGEPTRMDRALTNAIEQNLGEWTGEEGEKPAGVSRSQVQRLIEEGQVSSDGIVVKTNAKFRPGARIEIRFPPPTPTELIPEERDLEILFEDEHLLVLNKPPRLTVHPSATQREGTLVHALLHHVKNLSGIGGELRPGIVHRIDKNTSGALVITKTDQAHRKLVEVFSKHEIERVYWAFCYGTPKTKQSTITGLLGRNPTERKKMAVLEPGTHGGRKAVTHYKVIEEYSTQKQKPFASFLEITLETGRTHQIRVHLTSVSHSVLGDPLYGMPSENQPKWKALPESVREAISELPGQALHARVLGFTHPVTGEKLRFEAEPPVEFKKLASALGSYR